MTRSRVLLFCAFALVMLAGCSALGDLTGATEDALYDLTLGGRPVDAADIPGPDGVGIGWGEGGIIGVIAMFLLNFLRNYARRRRGEAVGMRKPDSAA